MNHQGNIEFETQWKSIEDTGVAGWSYWFDVVQIVLYMRLILGSIIWQTENIYITWNTWTHSERAQIDRCCKTHWHYDWCNTHFKQYLITATNDRRLYRAHVLRQWCGSLDMLLQQYVRTWSICYFRPYEARKHQTQRQTVPRYFLWVIRVIGRYYGSIANKIDLSTQLSDVEIWVFVFSLTILSIHISAKPPARRIITMTFYSGFDRHHTCWGESGGNG